MSRAEINEDDMRKSAITLEELLNKYRNQPTEINNEPTWSEEVQKAYNAIIGFIKKAKNGEIKEPVSAIMRPSGYFIYETPVQDKYPDLRHAYAVFCMDIRGWNRGPIAKDLSIVMARAKEKAMKRRKELGLD